MGQRPYPELPKAKQVAVLYRDTRRLRQTVERQLGPVTDAEWLRVVNELPMYATRLVRAKRGSSFPRSYA